MTARAGPRSGRARCRSRCGRWRRRRRCRSSSTRSRRATLDVDSGEQALRRRRSGGPASRRRQPRAAAPSRARPTSRAASARRRRSQQLALGPAALGGTGRPRRRRSARGRPRRRRAARARAGRARVAAVVLRAAPGGRAPGARLTARGQARGRDGAGARRRRRRSRRARCTRGRSARALDRRCSLDLRRRRPGTPRASISSRAAAASRLGRAAHRGEGAARRRAAAPQPKLRPHLRLDGRHPARRQGARLQPEDARADAQLRRLRRRRDPLRVGAGAGHLVAAVARVAADRRLPDGAQGDRARGEAVATTSPSSPRS